MVDFGGEMTEIWSPHGQTRALDDLIGFYVSTGADTANGQFVTGTIQSTGILAAGRNSIPEVTTKRPIYLTPR